MRGQRALSCISKHLPAYVAPELRAVVPTFNEQESVETLSYELDAVLEDLVWEVSFVDNRPLDGPIRAALARSRETRVNCIYNIRYIFRTAE